MADFPFDTVAFDLDGTLLDTYRDLGEAVNHALELGGFKPVSIESSKDLIGGGAKIMLAQAIEAQTDASAPIMKEDFHKLYKAMLAYYADHNAVHSAPYPHAIATLEALAARGVKLAVVTNKFEEFARNILTQLGLIHHFFTIIGGDTMGKGPDGKYLSKPAPDPIYEVQRRCAPFPEKPARTVFIGDSTYDVNAAKAANVPVIAVSYGYCDKPPHEMGADGVIDSLDQLIPALEAL